MLDEEGLRQAVVKGDRDTVQRLTAAALEAGRVIMLDRPAVIAQARTWGISLAGFE